MAGLYETKDTLDWTGPYEDLILRIVSLSQTHPQPVDIRGLNSRKVLYLLFERYKSLCFVDSSVSQSGE